MDDLESWAIAEKDFPGGMEVLLALRELRKNFAHGHYLSVILLGHMIIERQLVGKLHQHGLQVDRKILSVLRTAFRHGFIDDQERRLLGNLRLWRNSYLHYRKPQHQNSLIQRALILSREPQEILAQEAKTLMDLSETLALR
jgi:hypothetical protein